MSLRLQNSIESHSIISFLDRLLVAVVVVTEVVVSEVVVVIILMDVAKIPVVVKLGFGVVVLSPWYVDDRD